MKNFIYISIFIITLIGCSKEKDDESMVLNGTILDDCSNKPLTNFSLELNVRYTCVKVGNGCLDTYYFNTDANGFFSVNIEKKGIGADLRAYNGTAILDGITTRNSGKEMSLGTFIAHPTTSFVYRVKVNNPYNVGDTLQLSIHQGAYRIKIPAPLSDTTFPQVNNYAELSTLTYDNMNSGIVNIKGLYDITKGSLTNENLIKRELFSYALPACPLKIDTITIFIN